MITNKTLLLPQKPSNNYNSQKKLKIKMKNNISILFSTILLGLVTIAKANEVNVIIVNNSNYSIYGSTSDVHNGSFLVHDGPSLSRAEVKRGSTARFSTGQASPFCGTDGYVIYKAVANGNEYFFYVKFDVPYIGDNEFYYTSDAPFIMKHIVGGPGSNVTITFELTGGPTAVTPPAPPITLPTNGNAWAADTISWNSNITGMPEGNITDAFEFTVVAPSKFYPKYAAPSGPSFTSGTVSPESGRFSDFKPLPNVKVQVIENPRKEYDRMQQNIYSMSVNYTIANLPAGIPLEIRATPKFSFWKTGGATPVSPNEKLSKWTVYAEKTRIEQAASNFKINGCWVDAQGNITGTDNNASPAGKLLLNKQLAIIKKDVIIQGDDIFKVPGMESKKLQIQQSPVIKPINKANVKVQMIKQ